MLKPEVMPPGWQIAPDKHVSSDQPIAGGKPTHRFRFVLASIWIDFWIVGNPGSYRMVLNAACCMRLQVSGAFPWDYNDAQRMGLTSGTKLYLRK